MEKYLGFAKKVFAGIVNNPVESLIVGLYYCTIAMASYVVLLWLYSLFFSSTFKASHHKFMRFVRYSKPVDFLFDMISTLVGGSFTAVGGLISIIAKTVSSLIFFSVKFITLPLGYVNHKLDKLVSVLQESAHRQKVENMEMRLLRQVDRNRRREEIAMLQKDISREKDIANGSANEQVIH